MPKEKEIYSAHSHDLGITFSKSIGSTTYLASAARAKDGEITHTTKRIIKPSIDNLPVWMKLYRKMMPQNVGGAYKIAIRKELNKNNGKFCGEIYVKEASFVSRLRNGVVKFLLALLLFGIIPHFLIALLPITNSIAISVLEAFVPITIIISFFVLTYALVMRKANVGKYHGAEHMAILCVENEEPLTMDNIKKQRRIVTDCGITYIFSLLSIAAIVSIVTFIFISIEFSILRAVIRIASIFVAHIIFAVIMKNFKKSENGAARIFVRIVCSFGLFMQNALFVRIPDDKQIEVAIVGLKALFEMDNEDV